MKRLKDSSDVPEARLGNLLNLIYTSSKKKDKAAFCSPRGGMGTPGCVNKRAGG